MNLISYFERVSLVLKQDVDMWDFSKSHWSIKHYLNPKIDQVTSKKFDQEKFTKKNVPNRIPTPYSIHNSI